MPNGRPALNFADDSKPEKAAARVMFTMMQDINANYVAKLPKMDHDDDANAMVSCGTCHRGHVHPESFVPPKENEHEHHEGPSGQPPAQPH
jgi:hypothetical protein